MEPKTCTVFFLKLNVFSDFAEIEFFSCNFEGVEKNTAAQTVQQSFYAFFSNLLFSNKMNASEFHKLHGLGNDFIIFDESRLRNKSQWTTFCKKVCHRKLGIGCDQLILFLKETQNLVSVKVIHVSGVCCLRILFLILNFVGIYFVVLLSLGLGNVEDL